jgi:hypothetical protein
MTLIEAPPLKSAQARMSPALSVTSFGVGASANGLPFSNKRDCDSPPSNVALASRVTSETLAGLLNDPKVTASVADESGAVGSGTSIGPA